MDKFRLPRKQKKEFKKLYEIRYGCLWLSCWELRIEYNWARTWIWKELISKKQLRK